MPIQCPACDHEITTEGSAPRFCSQCGASLIQIRNGNRAAEEQGIRSLADLPESGSSPSDFAVPLDATTAFPSATRFGTRRSGTVETPNDPQSALRRLPEGSLVGPFRIDRFLGAGGMGTVYQATHDQTGQRVALKLLSKSVRTTDETVQRFQRESQIAASINHPRSTFVYGADQHEGQFYITMELMTGGTLDDIVKRDGPVEIGQAVDYVLDIIAGLQAAHEVGIVHRDLKPSNCFIDQTGRVKIGDFGLAKTVMVESSLTQTGAFMGTPQYAAPEQLRTSEVDERADIYAIGGTLFYLLAGRPPFVGNAAQVISSIASEMPPLVSQLDKRVPRRLSRVIHQTLEKSPDRRPENLDELRQMLLPYSTHGARAADPGRRLAAFFLDASLIGLAIGFVSQFVGIMSQMTATLSLQELFLANVFTTVVLGTGYFAILESWFGTTLGKWLLGMRVSTLDNLSPGFLSALLRASIMPGLSYLANSLPAYLLVLIAPLDIGELDSAMWKMVLLQFINLASWIPAALCFVTARKTNGFRGCHELVSGTRVVRISGSLDYKPLSNIPITLPVTSTTALIDDDSSSEQTAEFVPPQRFEEFRMIGVLGQLTNHTSRVYLARDESLDRDVWLFESGPESPGITPARKSVARTGRLRILKEDHDPERSTLVTEAVKGMPLVEYIRRTPNLDWCAFRPLLQELITELDRSSEDGTLPEDLCLAQVWVDRAAHTKLLDLPIVLIQNALDASDLNGESRSGATSRSTEIGLMAEQDFESLSPLDLTKSLLQVFIDNQVVPAHVLTFREEIEVLRGQPDELKQLGLRVGDLADLHSAWRWDDRIGVLAISIGLELSMTGSLIMAVALVLAMLQPGMAMVALTSFGLLSVAAFALGAMTLGGPVFKFFGVLVRKNRSLAPASAFRCACRTWIAWLPWILIATLFCVLMEHEIASAHPGNQVYPVNQLDLSILGMMLAILALLAVILLGAVYSIFRPSRGLPDLICGTRLIRK